jgi:hypothetical protein
MELNLMKNIYYEYSTLSGLIEKSSIVTPGFTKGYYGLSPSGLNTRFTNANSITSEFRVD